MRRTGLWWLRFAFRLLWMVAVFPVVLAIHLMMAVIEATWTLAYGIIEEWFTD